MAGIYIHIPFCRTICHYCDFYKVAAFGNKKFFLDALLKEIEIRSEYLGNQPIETIYFGGGTPSVLEATEIKKILLHISAYYNIEKDCEITLEANPDDLTDYYLASLCEKTEVNRLSIGVQSFRDNDLKLMNRRHNGYTAYESIKRTISFGIKNISIDLIYGIPGFSVAELEENLAKLFDYDIKHISAYHLTIEPGTVFYKKAKKGLINPVSEEEGYAQFERLIEKLGEKAFIHYEISNWAKKGYFSRHNTNYWKRKPYLGLGPSAHSYDLVSRQWNISNVKLYIEGIQNNCIRFERENLTKADHYNEFLLTSLRTMWGINLDEVTTNYGHHIAEKLIEKSKKYIVSNHIKLNGQVLKLTITGYFISDAIISDLMETS
jgi:oxygen-independent coproporphyrinogen-3 oxidase